jgi:cell wall assembly regulator SMI1
MRGTGDSESTSTLGTLWASVVTWLEENAPTTAAALLACDATDSDVEAAEAAMGLDWPDAVRVWLLLHGGSSEDVVLGRQLLPMYQLMSLSPALA